MTYARKQAQHECRTRPAPWLEQNPNLNDEIFGDHMTLAPTTKVHAADSCLEYDVAAVQRPGKAAPDARSRDREPFGLAKPPGHGSTKPWLAARAPYRGGGGALVSRRGVLGLGAAGGAAAALALAGCSSGSAQSSGGSSRRITAWTWQGAQSLLAGFNAALARNHRQLAGASVQFKTIAGGDKGIAQQFTLALAAHQTPPDIVKLNYTEVPEMAATGALADLSSILKPVQSKLYPGAAAITSYDGQMVAIPVELKSKIYYYRKDLFDKAGIDPATASSVSGFIEMGKHFRASVPGSYVMNLAATPGALPLDDILSAYPNASMASKSGKYELTTNPCFAQSMTFGKELYDSGIAFPTADLSADWPAAVAQSHICGTLGAEWMKTFIAQYAGPGQAGKWASMLWPAFSPLADQKYGSNGGGSVFVIPANAPNKDLAMEWLRLALLEPEGTKDFFAATGLTPLLKEVSSDVIASIRAARRPSGVSPATWYAQPQNFMGADHYTVEFDSFNYARPFGYDPSAIKEFDMLDQYVSDAMLGHGSVAGALKSAQSDMQHQVGNPYQSQ
jgi:ABC-type glycerol-3-phosphate transport system substrate-binding protein